MKKNVLTIFISAGIFLIPLKNSSVEAGQSNKTSVIAVSGSLNNIPVIYKTDNLIIHKFSDHVYEHTSFLKTKDFGIVPSNGMIVINDNEAVIFDTPADKESSEELINFVNNELKCQIKAVIPTHFHEDCVGGLEEFNKYNIPAYASNQTIELLKAKGRKFSKPIQGFNKRLVLHAGNKKVYAEYFGSGHTKDNIIGCFPEENAVFGGCLIKESGASKGNLEDADIKEWPQTVHRLKQKYPQAKIVIPGHGKHGGIELFDYTIKLFE